MEGIRSKGRKQEMDWQHQWGRESIQLDWGQQLTWQETENDGGILFQPHQRLMTEKTRPQWPWKEEEEEIC